MEVEPPVEFERRATRILLLQELTASFQKAQRAIVLSDLPGMEKHIVHQQELCRTLVTLGSSDAEQSPADTDPAGRIHWQAMAHDLKEMERRAHHLGRVQAALLRRSRRSLELLTRLLATTAVTYTPPIAMAHASHAGK